jgi:hypothetical protein
MIGVNLLKDRKMMTLEEAKRQAKEQKPKQVVQLKKVAK